MGNEGTIFEKHSQRLSFCDDNGHGLGIGLKLN